MKKSLLFLAAGFIAITANAQKVREHDVPTPVKQVFTNTYPVTEVKEWTIKAGNYTAEFDYNKAEISLLIDPTGHILETETAITGAEIPSVITDYINKNAGDKIIKEASKIVDHKGTLIYEVEAEGMDYFFDANGVFIKKEEEEAKK